MNFDVSFKRVFSHEGLYQSHREDRGNWTSGIVGVGELKGTKFGIAAMSYPELDIVNLTLAQAAAIYHRDWWLRLGMDRFRPAMQYQMFDAAINHGMYQATRMFQRAAAVQDDGIIGPNTMAAARATELNDMLMRFLSYRLRFMAQIKTWNKFGRGWAVRIADNLLLAAEDN